jgi:hypothetical protein
MVRVVVDLPATKAARKKYPLFQELIVGTFDQSFPLYRIFDENELRHILSSGKITGGQFSVKAEREHGASWGYNINEVIAWGNGQRGKRLGNELYLAKLDAFDFKFAHIGPDVKVDLDAPLDGQVILMPKETCRTGIGCSVINVGVSDVDLFRVDPGGQIRPVTVSELKSSR